jgi:hypothetical protein
MHSGQAFEIESTVNRHTVPTYDEQSLLSSKKTPNPLDFPLVQDMLTRKLDGAGWVFVGAGILAVGLGVWWGW